MNAVGVLICTGILGVCLGLSAIVSELRSIAHYLKELDNKHSKEYKT